MKSRPVDAEALPRLLEGLGRSKLFGGFAKAELTRIGEHGTLCTYVEGEAITVQGERSEAAFVLLSGTVSIRVQQPAGDWLEVAAFSPVTLIGEIGLLLNQPRTAGAVALETVEVLRFDSEVFAEMVQSIPAFALELCRTLADRVGAANLSGALHPEAPEPRALDMLPVEVMQRFRLLPLRVDDRALTVGFVDEPTSASIAAVRVGVPSMQILTVRIAASLLESVLAQRAGAPGWSANRATPRVEIADSGPRSPRLDGLLRRMVAEGASDLHLSGGQRPRWRIDGEIRELKDAAVLLPDEVRDLLTSVMQERNIDEFDGCNDTDFAYSLPGTARFRTNLFRDHRGVGAVLRHIPDKVMSFEQLGLPPAVRALTEHPNGLVLVTGPTGSGKSTTLAAMVDLINRTRRSHIITLEDPIEFVHESQMSLVNQREVGAHTISFARALKSALREDPDIVLVGEMRDLETVRLALETANTGHLVFGTLHTATAMSTVDRIVNLFSADEQSQVRATLADVLKGVVAQTLCRKVGGGRVAALEVLVSSVAVANMIRESKTAQIANAMSMAKAQGNQLLNEDLARLVVSRQVEAAEAIAKSVDKADLARRLGT